MGQLDKRNAVDTSNAEGKAYELEVINVFFSNGESLGVCIPKDSKAKGVITTYIKVSALGEYTAAYVLPEGGIAKCLLDRGSKAKYRKPPAGDFVAKAAINIKD